MDAICNMFKEYGQPIILYLTELSFKNEGEMKTFPGKKNPRALTEIRPALQEMLKGVLKAEIKKQ